MSAIDVEARGAVSWVTLARPERLNALGEGIRTELHAAVRALADDPGPRVLVIRGAGRAFSAGADLRDRVDPPVGWAARRHSAGRWQRLLDDLEALPQVTVAAVHGHVIGGGALLASACDLRIGAEDLALSIPEIALGIPLPWAGLPRLVREIGLPRTRELVMTGRVLGGREALEWGFLQRLVSPEELPAATDHLVSELLAMPPGPLATARSALAAIGRAGLGMAWADPDLLALSRGEPEVREAAETYRKRRLRGDR